MQIHNDFMRNGTVANALSETGNYNQQQTINSTDDLKESYLETEQRAKDAPMKLSQIQSVSQNELLQASDSLSKSTAEDVSSRYNVGQENAQQIVQASYNDGNL